MALQSSGAISLNDIATEFGGSTPHSLSEYYGVASGVPASGTISFDDFYGTSSDGTPTSNLIMYMKPSDYSGSGSTWDDSHGTNNQMTLVGSPTYTSTSPEYFTTGTNSFSVNNHFQVTTRPTGSYAAATFCAWVYRTGSHISGIFDIRYGNGTAFGMESKGTKLGYFWNNNNSGTWSYDPNLTIPANAWAFVGVAVNSTTAKFFLRTSSAESIVNRTYTHSTQSIGSTSTIYYAADPESNGRTFSGRVGHFWMYDSALDNTGFRDVYDVHKSSYGH